MSEPRTQSAPAEAPAKPRRLVRGGQLLLVAVAMFGFGYALVPLYGFICDITGLNGTNRGLKLEAQVDEAVDSTRTVRVEFLTTVNNNLPWEFSASQSSLEVHPGQFHTVTFEARNLAERDYLAQATPSVVPWNAAQYVLGSASRPGKVVPALFGPWVITDTPMWYGDMVGSQHSCHCLRPNIIYYTWYCCVADHGLQPTSGVLSRCIFESP